MTLGPCLPLERLPTPPTAANRRAHQIFIPAHVVRHQPPASCWGGNLIRKSGQEWGRQTTEVPGMEMGRRQRAAVPHKGCLGSRGRWLGNKSSRASRTVPIRSWASQPCGQVSVSSPGTGGNSTQALGQRLGLVWGAWDTGGAQGADVPSTATTKFLRASAWVFSATHVWVPAWSGCRLLSWRRPPRETMPRAMLLSAGRRGRPGRHLLRPITPGAIIGPRHKSHVTPWEGG